jgi:hypothetical protein
MLAAPWKGSTLLVTANPCLAKERVEVLPDSERCKVVIRAPEQEQVVAFEDAADRVDGAVKLTERRRLRHLLAPGVGDALVRPVLCLLRCRPEFVQVCLHERGVDVITHAPGKEPAPRRETGADVVGVEPLDESVAGQPLWFAPDLVEQPGEGDRVLANIGLFRTAATCVTPYVAFK